MPPLQYYEGGAVPLVVAGSLRPSSSDTFAVIWDDKLQGASITSVSVTQPAGWALSGQADDVPLVFEGVSYAHATRFILSSSAVEGYYQVLVAATLSDTRVISLDFFIDVRDQVT